MNIETDKEKEETIMANRSVTFNGKTFTNPGIYSAIKSDMTYSKQSSGSKIIALIGESTGGEPNTVHFFC